MRPLLLLDIDGPLSPFRRTDARDYGYEMRFVLGEQLWLNPRHGPMLTSFAEREGMELVWATTWEHHANEIGPLIGLPELPVITWNYTSPRYKVSDVLAYAGDRPLAWFDDDFDEFDAEWFTEQRGERPTLLHHIDPRVGLQYRDLDAVAYWRGRLHAAV